MKTFSLILCLAAACAAALAHAETVTFDAPLNGWRNSAGDQARYTQEVHYPASVVNTPQDQSRLAMIAGSIKANPKKKPAVSVGTLVVNGIAMPQRIEEDGRFSRPYAFDSGSNGVELIAPDGTRKRVQFYDAYAGKTKPRLRVVLGWDTDNTDLDLHIISPDGTHTFYGDRVSANGGALDVDVTTGFGPEIYSNPSPEAGTYLIYVNYFANNGNTDKFLTVAQINVITNEGTPDEKIETFTVPMRRPGETVLVKRFVMGN
jgi:uncharacterized protein YfaP (DUF2135 family)